MRPVNLIVIHCSASPNGRRVTVEDIDAWHAKRGFQRSPGFMQRQNPDLKAIGYHFVLYPNGVMATGRHLDELGAHVAGFNKSSIGICLIGTDAFSAEQWKTLHGLIVRLRRSYPAARIVGHRDLSPDQNKNGIVEPFEWLKTCPGFDVATWLRGGMAPLADHLQEV